MTPLLVQFICFNFSFLRHFHLCIRLRPRTVRTKYISSSLMLSRDSRESKWEKKNITNNYKMCFEMLKMEKLVFKIIFSSFFPSCWCHIVDAADADAVVVVVTTLLNLYFTMKFLLFLLVGLLEVHVLACIHSYCGNNAIVCAIGLLGCWTEMWGIM